MEKEIAKRYRLCSNCSDRILSGGCDGKCKEYWKYVGATEQKAIDEEVRLKKCDDMTKAEYNRETAFTDWYLKNGKGTPTYSDAIEWARKDLLNKAYEWIKENVEGGVHPQSAYGFADKFRKAIDE